MRSWFQRFMSGRYGFDQLGGFLCVVSFILVIVGAWVSPVLYWLGLILLIYSYFRVLSRNRSKRYAENLKYLTLQNKVVDWANRYILRFNAAQAVPLLPLPTVRTAAAGAPRARQNFHHLPQVSQPVH